jgi:hypothetical protein
MATEHRLAELTVIAACVCGRSAIADSEAAALARLDVHCADPESTPAPQCAGQMTLWDARLDGWARKVYGVDWDYHYDYHSVRESFERWLDDR